MPSPGQDVRLRMIVPPPLLPNLVNSTLLLNIQADALDLNDGDSVYLWSDLSGNENNFTQTGTTTPTYKTTGQSGSETGPYVLFDGVDDYMGCVKDCVDDLDSFSIVLLYEGFFGGGGSSVISKINNLVDGAGWSFRQGVDDFVVQEDGGNNWLETTSSYQGKVFGVIAMELASRSEELHVYVNGSNVNEAYQDGGSAPPIGTYSTSELIKLGTYGNLVTRAHFQLYGCLIYSPSLNSIDRSRIENWIATKYGFTLP